MEELEKAKRFTVYKNGDKFFSGARITLNRKKVANFDKLLDILTQQIHANDAVRRLCTPLNGTRIRSLDDIADDGVYVAVGNARFAKFGYTGIGKDERHKTHQNKENFDQPSHQAQSSPRNFLAPVNITSIRVFANGKEFEPDHRVILTRHMLQNWNTVLNEVSSRVRPLAGAAKSLYTLDGERVKSVGDLTSGQAYVVVGTELGGFQKLDYGRRRPVFNCSPKLGRRYYLQPLEDTSASSSKKSSGKSGATMFSDEEEDVDFHGNSRDYEPQRRQRKTLVVNGNRPKRDSSLNDKQKQRQLEEEELGQGHEETSKDIAGDGDDDGVFHAKPGKVQPKKQALNFEQGQDDIFHTKQSPSEMDDAKTVGETLDNGAAQKSSKQKSSDKAKPKKTSSKKEAANKTTAKPETTDKQAASKSKQKVQAQPKRKEAETENASNNSSAQAETTHHITRRDDVYEVLPEPNDNVQPQHVAAQRYRRDDSLVEDNKTIVSNNNDNSYEAANGRSDDNVVDTTPKSRTSRDEDRLGSPAMSRSRQQESPRNERGEVYDQNRDSPPLEVVATGDRGSRSSPREVSVTSPREQQQQGQRDDEYGLQQSPRNEQPVAPNPRTPTPPQSQRGDRAGSARTRSRASPVVAAVVDDRNDVRSASPAVADDGYREQDEGEGRLPLPRTPSFAIGEGEGRDEGASSRLLEEEEEEERRIEAEDEGVVAGAAEREDEGEGRRSRLRSEGRQSHASNIPAGEDHADSPREGQGHRNGEGTASGRQSPAATDNDTTRDAAAIDKDTIRDAA